MSDLHTQFEVYLGKHNQRYTQQKKDIVASIVTQVDPFEIETFLAQFNKDKRKIGRATLYRTIKQLLDAKLIQKIDTGNGRVCYKYNQELQHHDHMICNQCGQLYAINIEKLSNILNNECKAFGFTPEYRSLHIYGKCSNCRTNP
ncbi:MAG: transcriptional repressor [Candidatus Margulisbacteria bacterium]|jgi:Fur family ferric uptake transcriptional regulator|nr:transcriptional repressor [Candidatus Margulisiibacteriota bacterium]